MQIQTSFDPKEVKGTLYLVPTPIGNLEDMTFRAVRILNEVDLILAEDTRNSGILLKHYQIERPMKSFHDHSSDQAIQNFVDLLRQGQNLAVISDAGMPLINDPGHPLVQACLAEDIPVVALPGSNAALTALIASGLAGDQFTYYGFFPRKPKDQRELIEAIGQGQGTAIFYESPHRIQASLQSLRALLPAFTQVVVARELTKKFETYLRGDLDQLSVWLEDNPVKGEIVLLLEAGTAKVQDLKVLQDQPLDLQVKDLMVQENLSANQAIKQVAKRLNLPKNQVYKAYHQV